MQKVFMSFNSLLPPSMARGPLNLLDFISHGYPFVNATPVAVFVRTKKTVAAPSSENACVATSAIYQPGKGKIYDKKPFKFTCIAGKSYLWCTCGWSKTQPFCDSTHKSPHMRITLKPIRFIPRETKEFTFCNCKQTNNRPFCDGSHTREEIQAAIK